MRGQYRECFRLIEDNLQSLYHNERRPESFIQTLASHKRCFPAMEIDAPYFDYLAGLLGKNGLPAVIAGLIRNGDKIDWSTENFKQLAMEALGEERLEDALGYAELMIKTDQLSSGAHLLRGWVLRDLGRTKDACESFECAIDLNKTNFQARSALAELHASRDPQKAIELIEQAIALAPGDPELLMSKAKILLAGGDKSAAIEALEQASLLDPLNPEYIYEKAEILAGIEGQHIAALRQYGKVLAVSEGHLPTHARLCYMLENTQPEAALDHVARVLEARSDDVDAALLRARLLEKTKEIGETIRQYESVTRLDESCAVAFGALGRLYLPGDPARALSRYEKALELQPNNPRCLMGKGECLEVLGETGAAIEAYKLAIAKNKTQDSAYAALGRLLAESEPKAALSYLGKAISLSPENARYHQLKGELLLKSPGKAKDALDSFDAAVRYDPGNGQLRYSLGSLLEQGGKVASATEHYRTAASLEPGLEGAHGALGRLLWEREPESALPHLNSAIYLNPFRAEYCYLKSLAYLQLGQKIGNAPELVSRLKETLADDAKNIDAHQELDQLLDGDTPRVAMMYANRALELAPENSAYLCLLARILEQMGKPGKAAVQYRQAAQLDPGCTEAWFGLGKLSARSGKEDKAALEYLDRAIALNSAPAAYHFEKARVLARNPFSYKQALECFDSALSRDKHLPGCALAKARLLENHGEVFEAMDYYKRALLTDRDCALSNARLGVLLADLNPRASLTYLEWAAQLEPENYTHHIWRARAFYAIEQPELAEAALAEAMRLGAEPGVDDQAPPSGETLAKLYFALAEILYRRLPEVSLGYCQKAIQADPVSAKYPLLRGNIHRLLGEDDLAKASFEKALALDPRCHEALARIAEILYNRADLEAARLIERAIAAKPGNASYQYIQGLILSELGGVDGQPQTAQAIESVRRAVSLAPANITYREKLLELLGASGQRWQRFAEKRGLEKLRRQIAQAESTCQKQ